MKMCITNDIKPNEYACLTNNPLVIVVIYSFINYTLQDRKQKATRGSLECLSTSTRTRSECIEFKEMDAGIFRRRYLE